MTISLRSREDLETIPFRILLVEDDTDNQSLVRSWLRRDHPRAEVLVAVDGVEGVEMFQRVVPDLVLMDVQMPRMNGYDAVRAIRNTGGERMVPILFLTGVESNADLVRCLECGGDDFISKPINRTILNARIRSWMRKAQTARELQESRDHLSYERQVVRDTLRQIHQSGRFDGYNLNTLLIPADDAAGDVILSARRSDGGQHVFLGDFTGHGLPSALGAPTLADIFYSMTAKGFPLSDILVEINAKLKSKLPVGIFLAGVGLELDSARQMLRVWNRGLPEVLLVRNNLIQHRVASQHVPFGIVDRKSFPPRAHMLMVEPGDRIHAYSDGVLEARRSEGEMYGAQRYETTLLEILSHGRELNEFERILTEFSGPGGLADDVSMLQLTV
ncbi:MAG: SpoIIE family protein phosphatase [Magnetococcus sp. WYHC-3]